MGEGVGPAAGAREKREVFVIVQQRVEVRSLRLGRLHPIDSQVCVGTGCTYTDLYREIDMSVCMYIYASRCKTPYMYRHVYTNWRIECIFGQGST